MIRRYEKRDQEQVIALISGIQQEFGVPIAVGEQPDLVEVEDYYQTGAGNFWVALQGENVVGTIALLDIGNSQAALRKMFVAPEQRGSGLAKQLLDALLDWAKEKGIREIFLGTTAQFKAAQRFYANHGFLEIEKSGLPTAFPFVEVDTVFFRLSL